jgi:hypothetical protein
MKLKRFENLGIDPMDLEFTEDDMKNISWSAWQECVSNKELNISNDDREKFEFWWETEGKEEIQKYKNV